MRWGGGLWRKLFIFSLAPLAQSAHFFSGASGTKCSIFLRRLRRKILNSALSPAGAFGATCAFFVSSALGTIFFCFFPCAYSATFKVCSLAENAQFFLRRLRREILLYERRLQRKILLAFLQRLQRKMYIFVSGAFGVLIPLPPKLRSPCRGGVWGTDISNDIIQIYMPTQAENSKESKFHAPSQRSIGTGGQVG